MAKDILTQDGWSEVTKKGITYLRFRKTYNGERKEFSGKTVTEVKQKIKAFEESPTNRMQRDYQKMSLVAYMDECNQYYREHNREQNYNAFYRRKDYINHIAQYPLGRAQLSKVNEKLIREFLFDMVKKEYAKATINKDLAFLKRCLNRACDKGILKSNPADEVAPLKESEMIKATKVVEPLEIEDMEKFLREAKRVNTIECQINGKVGTRVYGVNADVVVFQLYSGLRIGEVLGLTWKDIDFEKDYIYVREALKNVIDENGNTKRERGTTKTQSSVRWVPLYSVARTILEEQRAQHPNASDDDLVFVNGNGNPIYTRNVNRTIRDMALRCDCGNKDIASHVMRHTFGAYLITKKVDLYIVSQLMGHASIRTTERVYTKLLQSLKDKEAINVFDDLNVE